MFHSKRSLIFSAAGLLLASALLYAVRPNSTAPAFAPQTPESPVIVIDAGHGGEDGGAVGADGTTEAPINLSIAFCLKEVFRLMGRDVVMTRTEDISLHESSAQTLRQKKASDLEQRAAFINQTKNAFLISIHQNSLPQAKSVHGAQAFYNEAGKDAADTIQLYLNQGINTEKAKNSRQIDSSVYLMRTIECPGVLVECGFLSNQEECRRLTEKNYQMRLALLIAAGFAQYEAGVYQ